MPVMLIQFLHYDKNYCSFQALFVLWLGMGGGGGGGGYNRGSINVKFCGINKFLTQNPITLTIFKTNLSKFVVVGQLKQKLPKQVNIGSLLKSY